jgi:hypothetical protein
MKIKPAPGIAIGSLHLLPVLLLLLWGMGVVSVAAQSRDVTWIVDSNLSNTPENSEYPAIVADDLGYVHVFWSEDVGGEAFRDMESRFPGNAIMYTRWDGTSWTQPVDILFVPGDTYAGFIAADVGEDSLLHVVWTGQADFYYSQAPSWQAESAHAWTKPKVVATDSARSAWESDVVADDYGNLHILYATRGDEPGVYHILSEDGGMTWGQATELSEPLIRPEIGFSHVRVITDGGGRLHAVWQTIMTEGFGQTIYYVRSIDKGQTWSAPIKFGTRDPGDYEASYAHLMSVSDSELHLIYIDGTTEGRYHRISRDGGETWTDPYHIATDHEGVNGYVFPLLDGAGQMHLIVNMRTKAQVGGLFYGRWLGDSWAPLARYDPVKGGHAEFHAGAVRLGNELHVVWSRLDNGEIVHVYGVVPSVSQTPPLPVPSPQPPTPTPSPPATRGFTSPTPTPFRQSVVPRLSSTSAQTSLFRVSPLVYSTGGALLLVAGVIFWTLIRRR